MIVLDTTVLTYAVGTDHPLREPCRQLLQAHGAGLVEATTTVEVIQEFLHVRARRYGQSDAVSVARHYATALPQLLTRPEDLEAGLVLYSRYPRLGAFDAMLAAVALNQGADALVSADHAFGTVPQLGWIDPGTPALYQLIRR